MVTKKSIYSILYTFFLPRPSSGLLTLEETPRIYIHIYIRMVHSLKGIGIVVDAKPALETKYERERGGLREEALEEAFQLVELRNI